MRALVRSRLRMAGRDWFAPPGSRVRRGWVRHPAFALGLALALAAFVHTGLVQALASLDDTGRVGLLGLALGGAALALLAFDVDDVVRSLLLDPDLELLRRAPLGSWRLLALKGLDSAPRTLPPLLALGLPAMTAFLSGAPAPGSGVPIALAALAALWFTTLSAGVALSLLLLRLAPARHAREALGLVSTLVMTVLWIAGAVALPHALAAESELGSSLAAALAAAAEGPGPAAAAARAVGAASGAAPDPAARAASELGVVLAWALAAFLGLALSVRFTLEAVLERVAGAPGEAGSRGVRLPASATHRHAFRWRGGGAIVAVLRRDARMLSRSWTLLADLAVASVLWGLLPLAGLAGGALGGAELVRLVLLTLAVGLGYEVAARAIPFERQAGYWARVAPILPSRYLLAKLLGATAVSLPILALVAGLLLGLGLGGGIEPVRTAGMLAAALFLSQSTGLWAGATFGDRDWVNPRAMLRFAGRLVASVLVLAQLAAWLAVAALLEGTSGAVSWITPLLVAVALSVLPMGAAARRLGKTGSPD